MSSPDTSRRLQAQTLLRDIDSMYGLSTISSFTIGPSEATPEALQTSYETMQRLQQKEAEAIALQKAAADAARLAEWEFHRGILSMKSAVRGYFGGDSDEAQAVGYKKTSNRKRPRRKLPNLD